MNPNDKVGKWFDIFSRELDRSMARVHKLEKPTINDVRVAFKFSTEVADASIIELERKEKEIVGVVEDALPEDSIQSVKG